MKRGYICLWRKVLENPILHERSKRYSKLEAWLWLLLKAQGVDDPERGLMRAQVQASERYLAKAWNWTAPVVHRFLHQLEENSMLTRVKREVKREPERFNICNYDIYNEPRSRERSTKRSTDSIGCVTGNLLFPDTYNGGSPKISQREKESKIKKERKKEGSNTGSSKMDSPGGERPKDLAYETFATAFLNSTGTPYIKTDGDFVHLAKLRTAMATKIRECPSDWCQAVRNYLETPQASHTMADLCVRYATFRLSALDRYQKPVEVKPMTLLDKWEAESSGR